MLILLTPEESNNAEKEQLIQFFEDGLSLLHVRKPGMSLEKLKDWLESFEEEHLNNMILHQHHKLATVFPLKGIHLKETFRKTQKDLLEYIKYNSSEGTTVSSSFHDPVTLEKELRLFDYAFLSPVFSSLSKNGYEGRAFEVKHLPQKAIALGGIRAERIAEAKELGYAGIAILGAVWTAKNKQKAFNKIYNTYRNVYV